MQEVNEYKRMETSPFMSSKEWKNRQVAHTGEQLSTELAPKKSGQSKNRRWSNVLHNIRNAAGTEKSGNTLLIVLAIIVVVGIAVLAFRSFDVQLQSVSSMVPEDMRVNPDVGKLKFVSIWQENDTLETFSEKDLRIVMPVRGDIVEKFGDKGITGISIKVGDRNRVVAAADGVIEDSGVNIPGLSVIVIRHSESTYSAYYFEGKSLITPGKSIKKGQTLGNASKGTVAFFEVYVDGTAVDPLNMVEEAEEKEGQ